MVACRKQYTFLPNSFRTWSHPFCLFTHLQLVYLILSSKCMYVCIYLCMYVCLYIMCLCYATLPKCFASRAPSFQGFIYDSRPGHLRPHGRVIYDPRPGHLRPTAGSSTTPWSGHLQPHSRVVTVKFFPKFTQLLPFL